MTTVRETVRLGLAARGQAKLKVRQPLRAAVVVAAGAEREAIERLPTSRSTSSTSRSCATSRQADELGSYEVKPNYRALGPRFGKSMPQVAAAVAALDPAHVADALRDGKPRRDLDRRPRPRARRRRPDARDEARWRATSSSARAPTPSPWSSSSTTSCAAKAWPARSSTRSRTPARPRACRSRTGSSCSSAATTRCWTPPASTRTTSPARRSRSPSPTTAPRPSR